MTPKKALGTLLMCLSISVGKLVAQTASFNFSLTPHAVSGWTNVSGDPSLGIRTGTSSGISVSSMATANWAGYNGTAAYDGGGASGGSFFPSAVMANMWYQYSSYYGAYNAAVPQLEISGLSIDSVYTIKMTTSFAINVPNVFNLNPTRYTVAGISVIGYIDVNGNFNTTDGATFHNIAPDANGKIHVYVNTLSSTNLAGISGLQVISGHTTAPTPTVSIGKPQNGDILPENASVTISAAAAETGGTIARVEFYANNSLLGADSSAPYNFVWANADPGNYTLKARAVDGTGNASTTTINVTVESLNYFWSTTGNIATGADSSFVGTVDTNDLAFRTNNIERMRMSKSGMISIPGTRGDSMNHPAFRVYSNGDLTLSTTTDSKVNTYAEQGVRYNARSGILQIGASDRIDSTLPNIAYSGLPTSALIINSDDTNSIRGRLMNTVFVATTTLFDSTWRTENSFIGMEHGTFTGPGDNSFIRSYAGGYNNVLTSGMDASILTGMQMQVAKPVSAGLLTGFGHYIQDTVNVGLVTGTFNRIGGFGQLTSGIGLTNKTPGGVAVGRANVDFASLSYTGFGGRVIPNLASYPILSVGNAVNADSTVGFWETAPIHSNALTVLYNGRTQINTTGFSNNLLQSDVTPKAALDVVSTNTGVLLPRLTNTQRSAIASGDLINGLLLYNTDSSVFQYYNGNAWNSVGSGAASGSSKWSFLSGTTGTVYDAADNVGIGTNDTKGYRLAVNGSVIATSMKVKPSANWPDYVFKKNYRLPSLSELEVYIRVNKHLPGISPAKEIEADGLNVGENQIAILKKVEELTLYLIDENKQLKAQNKQINDQNKQLLEQNAILQQQQREIDELKALIKNKEK